MLSAWDTVNGKYEGLVKGKKVFVLVASGGVYDPGSHSEKMDFFTSYMKFLLWLHRHPPTRNHPDYQRHLR